MQVTEHVHAVKIPFPGTSRFVYVYLIYGKKICLIDSGILCRQRAPIQLSSQFRPGSEGDRPDRADPLPSRPHRVERGDQGDVELQVAIHAAEKAWIEDIELQVRMRPTLTFRAFVQRPVAVDRALQGGETLDWEEGFSLQVIHTPGHSSGHVAIFLPRDGALFTGDGVPPYGGVPIYEDVCESIRSICKLKNVHGVKALFSSWHEPQQGEGACCPDGRKFGLSTEGS